MTTIQITGFIIAFLFVGTQLATLFSKIIKLVRQLQPQEKLKYDTYIADIYFNFILVCMYFILFTVMAVIIFIKLQGKIPAILPL